MGPKGANAKQQKGRELKAANKASKDAAVAKEQERSEAESWKKGSNVKGADRAQSTAEKADAAARKRAEKAALMAEEEAEMSSSKPKAAKLNPTAKSKKGKKKKNDISLLEEALVGNADKKDKAAKRADRLKKEREEKQRLEREKKKQTAQEQVNLDPLLANTNAMIGNSINGAGTLNKSLAKGEVDASGVDAALGALSIAKDDEHPEKRMRALHKAFEERMMPEVKHDYPGLKRSQYLEKIFALWKKSPENPMNWSQKE
mmetsp:Transcript_2753/g.4155  ORF Transcript_2753/g.4155 Transcript_2753/m.4155 type:complete len:260 (+) Transcript_2753:119-898(+)|eukprot:CAMPEP_0197232476 /NCGR_PEP_ID=MMETSP1429-20130617/722_1 /TAXON_ID=49237 /ORGANISM="Chaetoceros  sp., Strain UNC1202" /LENGTH=259 /DNA_ID=CAMNT_0042690503 /DNA_START=114 /DNA_END=893 /DNA_ORIENTATION=-